jgi:alpha-beta hydrolase superfamily lysophospholipase
MSNIESKVALAHAEDCSTQPVPHTNPSLTSSTSSTSTSSVGATSSVGHHRPVVLWRWDLAALLIVSVLLVPTTDQGASMFPLFSSTTLNAYYAAASLAASATSAIAAHNESTEEDMHIIATTSTTSTTTTSSLPYSSKRQRIMVDTQQLYASQERLKDYDWEWILVKIDEVSNLPMESLGTDFPDPQISMAAHGDLPDDIDFSGPLHTFSWPTQWNYNEHKEIVDENGSSASSLLANQTSDWKGLGIVAYLAGTATSVNFVIWEKNQVDQDYLIFNQTLPVLPTLNQGDSEWTHQRLTQLQDPFYYADDGGGIYMTVDISWKRMTKPLYTEADHANMGLKEHLLTLENGELASIAYKVAPTNNKKQQHTKAVLYLAGRSDSFAHPHVLEMYYDQLGYDFYALDPRRAGRARRFMSNPYLGNDVMDFADELYEDVDLALQFLHSQRSESKPYDTVVAHCHSNGALTLISYLLEKRRIMAEQESSEDVNELPPDFDGFILNSPFLDWGNVGGSFNEFLLKNAGLWNSLKTEATELYGHPGLSDWWTKIWLLYRWNLVWKPIFTNSLTSHYAQAASKVQWELLQLEGHLLPHSQPVLVLSSHADDILDHHETLRLAAEKVHPDPTLVELHWHSHDVTLSYTRELNDEALSVIVEWLDDLDTYRTVN